MIGNFNGVARRMIVIDINPEQREAFGIAFGRWADAEPLVTGVEFFGDRVTARLMYLRAGPGPNFGQMVDDRPRAAALLRSHVPESVVRTATVDGKDWRE